MKRRFLAGTMAVAVAAVGMGIGTADAANAWAPPPANATFDYQIGEPYTPPAGVTVVSRQAAE